MEIFADYKKYKWFFTSSDKLVVGGKSAEQNDNLLKALERTGSNYIAMHTKSPGSPFSIILEENEKVNSKDIEECAIFTVSFSREWKLGKKEAKVDVFTLSQVSKPSSAKTGTWAVRGNIDIMLVPLKLVLTEQEKTLRAVPEKAVKDKKKILLSLIPGKNLKESLADKIMKKLKNKFKKEEILSALPAGGIEII